MFIINGRLEIDGQNRRHFQQPLPCCSILYQFLPYQDHTSKKEQSAARDKTADSRRDGSVKGAQYKDPQEQGHQLRCFMCLAKKQLCKTEYECGKCIFFWPLTTPGRHRGMISCGMAGTQEVTNIRQRQSRKKTFGRREDPSMAEQTPMKTSHYSSNKMLTVGLLATSGWGWRRNWGLLHRLPLFLLPLPTLAHGWRAAPDFSPHTDISMGCHLQIFPHSFLLKQCKNKHWSRRFLQQPHLCGPRMNISAPTVSV